MSGKPSSRKVAEKSELIQLQFEKNALMPLLYGEHDRHLSHIEAELGVSLIPRGNLISISGPHGAAKLAASVLRTLYGRLENNFPVDDQEVAAALRLEEAARQGTRYDGPVVHTQKRHITPRSPRQAEYLNALAAHGLVFGLGPAGTGKTYLAVSMAVSMLMKGQIDRIILSRPAVEAGEKLGFLPGDLREKVDPYLRPLYDALHDMMPSDQVGKRIEAGDIEVAPLAFMRGRTLSNAFVILDEAQNTTSVQMKMFLTRLGENSRMAITGDLSQVDLPSGTRSGLRDAVEILQGVDGVAFVSFTDADVVRHPLVSRIVRAYDAFEAKIQAGYEYIRGKRNKG